MNANCEGKNRIELKCDEKTRECIYITIEGEGDIVGIDEMVEVKDRLMMHIVDNNNIVHIVLFLRGDCTRKSNGKFYI